MVVKGVCERIIRNSQFAMPITNSQFASQLIFDDSITFAQNFGLKMCIFGESGPNCLETMGFSWEFLCCLFVTYLLIAEVVGGFLAKILNLLFLFDFFYETH